MNPVILLIGKNGQIGAELSGLLPKLAEVAALDRSELDLSRRDDIRRIVREVRPRIIVNAAAYTAVDAAEKNESEAYAINAEAPGILAEEAKRLGALLVHFSTDYVFDGSKRSPYNETDETNPLSVYGKSKLAGEQAIRSSDVKHLIFRTAWVYATRGRNFLLTILRIATEREELRIVSDQVGAPSCAWDLAVATSKILSNIYQKDDRSYVSQVSGTYHMTAAGQTTWYDFAKSILEKTGPTSHDPGWVATTTHRRQLIARRVIPISTEEFGSPTHRPAYSVLSNSRLLQTFGVGLPDWRTQLQRCFAPEGVPATFLAD